MLTMTTIQSPSAVLPITEKNVVEKQPILNAF